MARLPPLPQSELNERQRAYYAQGWNSRPGDVTGPPRAQMLAPDLADASLGLSTYLKKKTSINQRVLQFVMLVCAREWTAQYVWYAHEKLALKAGLSQDIIDAVKHGETPRLEREDERTAYQMMRELFDTRKLRDETYKQAVRVFTEAGVLELVYVIGFYSLHSMVVNTFEIFPLNGDMPLDEK